MGLFRKIGILATLPLRIFATKTAEVIPTTPTRAVKLGGRVLGGIALALPPVRAFIGKSIIPTTLKGKIITATALLFGGGALVKSPILRAKTKEVITEAPEFLAEAPVKIVKAGGIFGEVIEDPSTLKEKALDIVKGAGVVGAVAVGGLGVAKIIEKVKEDKVIVEEIPSLFPVKEKELGKAGEIPILPETQKITTGKKPYKRRRAKITPSVRQSIKINIINKPTSRSYLNQALFH